MQLTNLFKRNINIQDDSFDDEGFSTVKVSGVGHQNSANGSNYRIDGITEHEASRLGGPHQSRPGFWQTMSLGLFSPKIETLQESLQVTQEPFNLSRKVFDSYRRSFDISTPSTTNDNLPDLSRPSTDSSVGFDISTPQSELEYRLRALWPDDGSLSEQESIFEEIALDDDSEVSPAQNGRGLFNLRFGGNKNSEEYDNTEGAAERSSSSRGASRFDFFSSPGWAEDYVDDLEELDDLSRPSTAGSMVW